MSLDPAGPNAAQVTYWSETTGPRWVEQQELLDAQIGPLGQYAIERAGIGRGDRVLDVGCGCGQTLLQLGECVGPEGHVLGIDISDVMLARATERVASAGLDHVTVSRMDAQTASFDVASFDHLFSRFGVMFFADPTAAFANLRRALVEDGQATFVCWQALARNPWMQIPMRAAAAHVAMPPPPEPNAPGPYSFADRERVRGILEAAGFRDVRHESVERQLLLGGGGLEGAVSLSLQMGPASAAIRLARERGEAVDLDAICADIAEALTPHLRDGDVWLGSASWIVQARA